MEASVSKAEMLGVTIPYGLIVCVFCLRFSPRCLLGNLPPRCTAGTDTSTTVISAGGAIKC
eukprot:6172529-Pleurochrysis_carterae.AAC.1